MLKQKCLPQPFGVNACLIKLGVLYINAQMHKILRAACINQGGGGHFKNAQGVPQQRVYTVHHAIRDLDGRLR